MEVAFELVDDGAMHLQSPLVDTLREAQRSPARGTTLAALIRKTMTPSTNG